MSMNATSLQPVNTVPADQPAQHDLSASLLGAVVLSVYAAKKSSRNFRKMKRHFLWNAFKLKFKSLFTKKANISNQTLIYILLGVILLVLVFTEPILALVLALVALILILAGVI
jgi:hypothetical protein